MKHVWKFWWGWQNEVIAHWLEEQAKQGWIFDHTTCTGVKFHFQQEEPKELRYVIEYCDQMTEEYEDLLHEDGWKVQLLCPGWYVFSQPITEHTPEFYSDYSARIAILQKQFSFLSRVFLFFVISSFFLLFYQYGFEIIKKLYVYYIAIPVYILYGYMLYHLNKEIRLLKHRNSIQPK